MIRHVAKAFFKSTAYFLVDLPVTLLGLLVVWLALPYRWCPPAFAQTYSQHPEHGSWRLERLPCWALLWDNCYDGMLGDKRGWWANYCLTEYKKPNTDRYCMWKWAAIRNPANYWSRVVCGVDVSRCTMTLLAGQEIVDEDHPGWHFMVATRDDGKEFHSLEFVLPWFFDKTHAVYGRFGWKVKMSHTGTAPDAREQDRIKGHVYRVSPWKEIA